LRGVDVDHDAIDALRHHILDARDDSGHIALGVNHIDFPAQFFGAGLKRFDIKLRAGLRQIGRDHCNLFARSQSGSSAQGGKACGQNQSAAKSAPRDGIGHGSLSPT
jgi:hypothetical protein